MKKITSLLLIFILVISTLLFTACGQEERTENTSSITENTTVTQTTTVAENTTTNEENAETRTIIDMNGDSIEIKNEPAKIMTCVTISTTCVLMLGGTDAVATVGQGFDYTEGSLNYKMFPGLEDVPYVTRESANAEEIAKIDPTIVLMDVPDIIETLRGYNIPTAYVSVTSPETLMQSVQVIGDILGSESVDKANQYISYYQGMIDDVTEKTKDIAEEDKPLVYYGRAEGGTAGKNTIPEFWIEASGGISVASMLGLEGSRATINDEDLLQADPDIIITETPELAELFKTAEKYSGLSAVKNGQVYCNPTGWGMGSVDSALQLVWAPTIIQPELFADNDIEAATQDFYKTFFGYELSESERDAIIYPDQQ